MELSGVIRRIAVFGVRSYAVTAAATGRPAEHDRVGGGFILWEESLGPDTRGEGLREILYQPYDLRGFFRFANLLAIECPRKPNLSVDLSIFFANLSTNLVGTKILFFRGFCVPDQIC